MEWYFYVKICHIIYPYRVVLNLSWYSKELKIFKENKYLHSWVQTPYYFEEIRYCWHAKKSKRYFKGKINIIFTYGVFALSHQCRCVSTKISSITEERLSRNRRIHSLTIYNRHILVDHQLAIHSLKNNKSVILNIYPVHLPTRILCFTKL